MVVYLAISLSLKLSLVASFSVLTHIEAVQSSLRNQFDRNLVFNFGHQEQIFDYAFSHLDLGEELSVEHPVVMTEPVCNSTYCR